MFYIFLLIVAALGVASYLIFFMSHVPGAKEERFGHLEPLPLDLGQWTAAAMPDEQGRIREQRHLFNEKTGFGAGRLVLQVRFWDAVTNAIVHVEDEQIVPRRRIRH